MRFTRVALSPDPDLAVAALMIARVEYPKLDARPYLDELDTLGPRGAPARGGGAAGRRRARRRPRRSAEPTRASRR